MLLVPHFSRSNSHLQFHEVLGHLIFHFFILYQRYFSQAQTGFPYFLLFKGGFILLISPTDTLFVSIIIRQLDSKRIINYHGLYFIIVIIIIIKEGGIIGTNRKKSYKDR